MAEVEAAREWGLVPDPNSELPDSWWLLPRQARALMVGYTQLKSLTVALTGFDAKGYWEKYWASLKPAKGGRN